MGRADCISISLCGAIFNVFVALTSFPGLSIIIFIMHIYNESIVASVLYLRCFYHNLYKIKNPLLFGNSREFRRFFIRFRESLFITNVMPLF